jgi:hypothetical protein
MYLDIQDYITIAFWWNILAWMAVGIHCGNGKESYLTICQMFWIMVIALPLMAIVGGVAWAIGTSMPNWNFAGWWFALINIGEALIGIACFVIFLGIIAFIIEYSPQCKIIWRRK